MLVSAIESDADANRDAIDQQDAPVADANETPISAARSQELLLLLTIWYVLIESARTHEDIDVGIQVRDTLSKSHQ